MPEAPRTFEYQTPQRKHYLRAALEELGLIGAGLGYYFIKQQENSIDWALDYTWRGFRSKLTCESCALDQNFFDTNYVTHPLAGTLYYIAARGNRLTVLESLGYALTMSTLWEFVGEFRERVSVNDLIVTPLAGLAIGESTTQIGAFFDRGCPSAVNSVLGSVFGPSKSIHDGIDGARLARARSCDAHGFSRTDAHRFAIWAGAASVWERPHDAAFDELRFGLSMDVSNLEPAGETRRGWVAFSDGNLSSIDARVAIGSGYMSDLRIGARVVPAGLHYRNLTGTPGFLTRGHEVTTGLLVGTEYSIHRQGRPAGPLARFFVIDALATRFAYALHGGAFELELSLDAGATFAGISTFALAAYRRGVEDGELATVTRLEGYSHALGFALAPRARLRMQGAELGVDARGDQLSALRVFDPERAAHGTVPIFESRRRGELWLSIGPPDGVARATLFVDGYERGGSAGAITVRQHEVGCGGRLEAVF